MAVFIRALALVALAAGLALPATQPADAQGYPNRPIKVIVPFPPAAASAPSSSRPRIQTATPS